MSAPTEDNSKKVETPSAPIVAEETVKHDPQKMLIKCSFCENNFFLEKLYAIKRFTCVHCGGALELTAQRKQELRKELGLLK